MASLGRLNEGKNSAGGGAMYSITGAGHVFRRSGRGVGRGRCWNHVSGQDKRFKRFQEARDVSHHGRGCHIIDHW